MIGQRLLHYEIIEVLGQGGMGTVYQARDTRLNRLVALKVFARDRILDAEKRQRFIQEAQVASSLNHPHIVTIYDIGQADGDWFIAMEYVPGQPLSKAIPYKGMPLDEVLRYAIQIADALACAHAAGIIHRDLKPGNVMVTANGATKLVDFGLAKLFAGPSWSDSDTAAIDLHTREGTVIGTAAYMSPEQAEGLDVDARTDVFSFGAVLYEMATGQRAFRGQSAISTLASVLREDPQPMTAPVPRDLEKIVTRCLRKDPSKRFQSMADVRVVLEDLHEELRPRRRRPALRRSPRVMWGAAAVLAATIAGAAGWFLEGRPAAPAQPVRVTPLATYPGVKDFPAISRDGSVVAFSWRKPGTNNFDVYVLQVGGGPPVQRTTSPEDDYFPSLSPDGQTIVFVRGTAFATNSIIAIPTLGGPEQRIASWGGAFFGPAWTADGRHLIVNDRARPGEPLSLFTVSLDTGERRPFVALPAGFNGIGDVAAVFSPDGRKLLVYRLVANLSGDLFIQPLSADGVPEGAPSQLTRLHLWVNGLGFAPDGASVLFSGVREHGQALWSVSIEFPGYHRASAVRGAGRGVRCRLYREPVGVRAPVAGFQRHAARSGDQNGDAAAVPQLDPRGHLAAVLARWQADRADLHEVGTARNLGVRQRRRRSRAAHAKQRRPRRGAAMVARRPQPCAGVRRGLTVVAVDRVGRSRSACTTRHRCHVGRRERAHVVTGRPVDLFLVDAKRDECHLEDAVRRWAGRAGHPAWRLLRTGVAGRAVLVLHQDLGLPGPGVRQRDLADAGGWRRGNAGRQEYQELQDVRCRPPRSVLRARRVRTGFDPATRPQHRTEPGRPRAFDADRARAEPLARRALRCSTHRWTMKAAS